MGNKVNKEKVNKEKVQIEPVVPVQPLIQKPEDIDLEKEFVYFSESDEEKAKVPIVPIVPEPAPIKLPVPAPVRHFERVRILLGPYDIRLDIIITNDTHLPRIYDDNLAIDKFEGYNYNLVASEGGVFTSGFQNVNPDILENRIGYYTEPGININKDTYNTLYNGIPRKINGTNRYY